jgi:aspartyl-tRNA(Asn)/glutamyl-tRNA(Gln) amidotransferase subunit B
MSKYEVVIGLEVHAQLLTKSKIYSGDANNFGDPPNQNISVITLAHPGTLPKLNRKAVELAIKMGLACQSKISEYQIFDRKNYFYPDLPKGYQLTQDRTPICVGGCITIDSKEGDKKIILNRIHIEEDAGKLIHDENEIDSLVDFNRAGTPLIEIVTEPVIGSPEDAGAVLAEIRQVVKYLGICDGNMEEGSLRCDANVSMKLAGSTVLGKKVEVKNMNSIRNVQRAIEYEMERQMELLEMGEPVISETRTFEADCGKTFGMRTKEELNDYRYFPDPDLSPLHVSKEWLQEITLSMPQLPRELKHKFITVYGLPEYDSQVLTEGRELASYFEEVCKDVKNYKSVSNWLMGPVKSWLNETGKEADQFPVRAKTLAALILLVEEGKLSFANASQKVLPKLMSDSGTTPLNVVKELNLIQDSNEGSILPIVEEVLKEFPLKVEEYMNGKKGILTMFMGEVMKRSKGKADPKVANELLLKKLQSLKGN